MSVARMGNRAAETGRGSDRDLPRDELVAADPFADVDVVPVHLLDLVVLRTVVCISDVRGSGLGWVREDGGLTGRPRAKRPHIMGASILRCSSCWWSNLGEKGESSPVLKAKAKRPVCRRGL